jgi:hypothetical protein
LLPTKHEVRTAADGADFRAKAGIAVSRVTRHTTALMAPEPISVLFKFVIIVSASSRAADVNCLP